MVKKNVTRYANTQPTCGEVRGRLANKKSKYSVRDSRCSNCSANHQKIQINPQPRHSTTTLNLVSTAVRGWRRFFARRSSWSSISSAHTQALHRNSTQHLTTSLNRTTQPWLKPQVAASADAALVGVCGAASPSPIWRKSRDKPEVAGAFFSEPELHRAKTTAKTSTSSLVSVTASSIVWSLFYLFYGSLAHRFISLTPPCSARQDQPDAAGASDGRSYWAAPIARTSHRLLSHTPPCSPGRWRSSRGCWLFFS